MITRPDPFVIRRSVEILGFLLLTSIGIGVGLLLWWML